MSEQHYLITEKSDGTDGLATAGTYQDCLQYAMNCGFRMDQIKILSRDEYIAAELDGVDFLCGVARECPADAPHCESCE